MTTRLSGWAIALVVHAALPARAVAQPSVSSSLEITAAQRILASYRPAFVAVDSLFAVPGQAPQASTNRARPHVRQELFTDLIQSKVAGAADTVRIRASDPEIRGNTATITVTVDGTARDGRRFYETVEYVFHFDGRRWQLRSGVQLGIS